MDVDEAAYREQLAEFEERGWIPPLHHMMGIEVHQLTPTTVLTMQLGDSVRGFARGSIHGGMLATFADIAAATCLWRSFNPEVELPVTTDMHLRYYRQPKAGPLTAEASVVHRGSRLLSAECSVTDATDRLLARATATYMLTPRPAKAP